MALSALAVENKKLNHKRPELQLLPVGLGEGRVAPHRGGPSGGRGVLVPEKQSKVSDPRIPTQRQMDGKH